MAKNNYFDNEDDIVTKKSVTDSIKPVFSSLLGKINEQKALQAKEAEERRAEKERHTDVPLFPEDILEMINADAEDITADIAEKAEADVSAEIAAQEVKAPRREITAPTRINREKLTPPAQSSVITVSAAAEEENEPENEDIVDAIKAFSHKSGEKVTLVAHNIKESAVAVAAVIEEKEKSSSKFHRALVVMFMMLVTVIVFVCVIAAFMHQMTVENDRIAAFNTEAGKVCADYVNSYGAASYENLYTTYGVDGCRLTGICFIRELDFDDDGTSELMISYNKNGAYYNDIWGFNEKDEFSVLFSEKTAQSEDKAKDAYSTLYRRNNRYYIGVHGEKDINKIALYQLKSDKFSKRFDCVYDEKTQSYAVDGKDDTTAFERIKYSVFKPEKAAAEAEKAEKLIDGFSGNSDASQLNAKVGRKKAYYNIVQEYNKRYGTAKYVESGGAAYIEGLAVVDLIDFDGDGKNELFLIYRKPIKVRNEGTEEYTYYEVETYCCEVYRYTGTKAVLAYSREGISEMPDEGKDEFYILKKDGKKTLYCNNSFNVSDYGKYINANSTIYSYDGSRFTSVYSSSYETKYGYTEYFLEGEEVSKSEFDEDGWQVPLFDGEEKSYGSDYTVVYVQRSTKNKDDITSLPDKTEKAIQRLNPAYSAE